MAELISLDSIDDFLSNSFKEHFLKEIYVNQEEVLRQLFFG